jgi:DNA-binding response OmpR family regulator
MAAILIVEEDGVLAQQMARTLHQTGHLPILASDAHSALREAEDRPDVILLDLELAEQPGEGLLARLQSQPDTVHIPVLAITWKKEDAAYLKEKGGVADVLLKPVSGVHLREAVDTILATRGQPTVEALQLDRKRQQELILLLIARGPDPLVFHISRRICADRTGARSSNHAETLTWADIADWGRREGLLDAEQASLLCRVSTTTAPRARYGTA